MVLPINSMLLNTLQMMQAGQAAGRVVPNLAALRKLSAHGSLNAVLLGRHTPGDQGGGMYWQDVHDKTSADNGSTVIVAADGMRWKRAAQTGEVSVRDFGAQGDGRHDDSAAIQAAIDHNKGGTIVIPEGRYLHAGVLLDGPSYNGTTIICRGELLLKARPSGRDSNLQGAYAGLIIRNCDHLSISYRGHGNRTQQPMEEHCFNVVVAGAQDVQFPSFVCREIRGDAVYITQADLQRPSRLSDNIRFGTFDVANSEDDGRNAMSIISGNNITVDDFKSVRVGGKVNIAQPGGFDIEPNTDFQTVDTVWLKKVYIDTAGNFGLQCFGKGREQAGGNVSNIRVDQFDVRSRSPVSSALVAFRHCRNLQLNSGTAKMDNPTCDHHVGLLLDNAVNAQVNMTVNGGLYAAVVSFDAAVSDSKINLTASGYRRAALATAHVSRCDFTVKASNGGRRSSALYTRSWRREALQSDVVYRIDCPQATTQGHAGCINEPFKGARFHNVRFEGGNLAGYSGGRAMTGFGGKVRLQGVRGAL